MGRCYSMDLRERVVARIASGHSRRSTAEHFGVSESFAIKLMQRQSRAGSAAPARQGRPRGSGKLATFEAFLIGEV
ncbi:IS630 family transposase, partial [Afifella marina DSM 2698]